ncbi:hypothetical protein JOD54_001101 [Actinokineospora baliensis]|uniref:hypothetical protein n=1 Tax=Actinokineospora baliensis TaxID=547056 RepID=UPI00195657F9|nr:hypothetical protein [Actinokineospora baliensis]MBM7770897.1 hypothetical protein [Actinokineospora baliensis]
MTEHLRVRVDDLTVGEIDDIEEVIGASIDSIGAPGARKGKFLLALALVMKRRDDPTYTIEQARGLRITLDDSADAANPTRIGGAVPVAGNRAARRAPSPKRA